MIDLSAIAWPATSPRCDKLTAHSPLSTFYIRSVGLRRLRPSWRRSSEGPNTMLNPDSIADRHEGRCIF
jgi:hypothetical protein